MSTVLSFRSWRARFLAFGLVLFFLLSVSIVLFFLPFKRASEPHGRVDLDVNPATTVYTTPVRSDGTIDYIDAINRDYGAGIVPAENAFEGLFRLLPAGEFPELQDLTRLKLGIEPGELTSQARLLPWADFYPQAGGQGTLDADALTDLYSQQLDAPLDSTEWLELAQWVRANASVLDQAELALARPRYWAPLVDWPRGSGLLFDVREPHTEMHRELARAYCARIKLALSEGDLESVIRSYQALRRLAMHQSYEPFLIPALVAMSVEAMAFESLSMTLATAPWTSDALARLQESWKVDAGRAPIVEALRVGERCMALDGMMQLAAGRASISGIMTGGSEDTVFDPLFVSERFDIHRSLAMIQASYALLLEIIELEDYSLFWDRIQTYEAELDAFQQQAIGNLTTRVNGRVVLRGGLTDSEVTEALTRFYLGIALVVPSAPRRTDVRVVARHRAGYVAIACERYRLEFGTLPDSLEQLVPEYMDAVPIDPIDGQPMRYVLDNLGYTVYSIGTNQVDDGGVDDHAQGDTVFRVDRE